MRGTSIFLIGSRKAKRSASSASIVYPGDVIRTLANGKAEIIINRETVVRAYPQLDVTALLMAKTKMDVKPLPGHVPKNLTGIITKAMANATGERYATAQSMGYDLENALRSTPAAAGYGILEGLVKRFNQ